MTARLVRAACVAAVAAWWAGLAVAADGEPRGNFHHDPFLQVTAGLAACPAQPGPMVTRAEVQADAHQRAERGTSCFQAGRCRLPNSYLYDAEIIPRVQRAVLASGRFADTSLWVLGQRRWVWLQGCVRSTAQAAALEALVRGLDDVEAVINELAVLPPP